MHVVVTPCRDEVSVIRNLIVGIGTDSSSGLMDYHFTQLFPEK